MSVLKQIVKGAALGISLILTFPLALLSAFGRIEPIYLMGAQGCALLPGLPGDYLRIAYYRMTLEACALHSRIQFGSFFSHPQVRLGHGVYIGAYCVLGCTSIGDRTQISSAVQILSGRYQHGRDRRGRILGSDRDAFQKIDIGADCWIGSGAIVMADIGNGTTIGAGSVVTKPIPAGTVAVGNPAQVIKVIQS